MDGYIEYNISKIKNTTLWKNLSDNADNLIRYTISKEFKNTDEKIISNALKFLSQNLRALNHRST